MHWLIFLSFLKLLYQEPNTGVRYEYSLPNEVAQDVDDTYEWKVGPWQDCSLSCGGGEETQFVIKTQS